MSATRCPKCATELRSGALACGACGLAADRFAGYRPDGVEGSPELLAAWQVCLAGWESDAAHERFRALASATGGFAFAAGVYRQAGRERAGDPRAADGLARVQRMAEVALLARPATGHDDAGARIATARARLAGDRTAGRVPYRGAASVLVALLLLAALGMLAAFLLRTVHRETPDPPSGARSQGRAGASVLE